MCNYPESCPLSAAGEFGGNSWPPSSRRALTDDITGEQVNATWDYQYVCHSPNFVTDHGLSQREDLYPGDGDGGPGGAAAVPPHPEGVLAGPGAGAAQEDVQRGDLHRELLHRDQVSFGGIVMCCPG